jgi:hypothetical protein
MSQNSEGALKISKSEMQTLMNMMQELLEQYKKQTEQLTKRGEQLDKWFEQSGNEPAPIKVVEAIEEQIETPLEEQIEIPLSETIGKLIDDQTQRLLKKIDSVTQEITASFSQNELNDSKHEQKGRTETAEFKEQVERSNERQAEVSERLSEQVEEIQETEEIPATEIRETKETRAMEISGRHGERKAPDEQNMEAKVAERISSKPRKRRVRSLTAAGACRKKKKSKLSKKWELRRKTMHGKSTKEAFQAWIDQVRKKHREQMNNEQRRTTRLQRHVPWDPGGFIYEMHSSEVSNHRSQYPVREITTSTPIEATNEYPVRDCIHEISK